MRLQVAILPGDRSRPLKVLAQRLGHADVAVSLRVYAHATRQDDEATAAAVGALLYGRVRDQSVTTAPCPAP